MIDKTLLYEKLTRGAIWAEFSTDEKWAIHALQSYDYLYHTHFITCFHMGPHGYYVHNTNEHGDIIYKADNDSALRFRLKIK